MSSNISTPSSSQSSMQPLIFKNPILIQAHDRLHELDLLIADTYHKIKKEHPLINGNHILNVFFGSPSSCVAKTGMISNVFALVGAFTRNPTMLVGGLIVSSTMIIINYEEERQREILTQLLEKLQKTNISLEMANSSLRIEIQRLQESINMLREENDTLSQLNLRLEDNISDLQRKISSLSEHITHLERCNIMFEGHLSTLTTILEKMRDNKAPLAASSRMASDIEDQLEKIATESNEFASFFSTTESIIQKKQEDLAHQITLLSETIGKIFAEVEGLAQVPGVESIKEHLLISLKDLEKFQNNLQNTQQDLSGLQLRCRDQHHRIERSQSRCTRLLSELPRYVLANGGEE